MGTIEDTYNRISYAVITILATRYWPRLIGQEQSWATPVFIVFSIALSMYLSKKVKQIKPRKCDAAKLMLTLHLNLFNILVSFIAAIPLADLFEDDIGNDPSLDTVFKPVLFMMALAVFLSLYSISGYYAAEPEP